MAQPKFDKRRRSKVTKCKVIFFLIRAPGLKFCLRYNKFYGKGNEKVPEIFFRREGTSSCPFAFLLTKILIKLYYIRIFEYMNIVLELYAKTNSVFQRKE
jgi:hypothetical protein